MRARHCRTGRNPCAHRVNASVWKRRVVDNVNTALARAGIERRDRVEVVEPPASERVEAAELIVEYLERIGIGHVFGVPGGAIEPIYNALARSARRGGVKAGVARHEAGAAFMAGR